MEQLLEVFEEYPQSNQNPLDPQKHLTEEEFYNWVVENPRAYLESRNRGIPKSFPTPIEVAEQARALAEEIFAEHNTLLRTLERYEALIQKRWLKKGREPRQKVLLTAWPGMSKYHRPDIKAFFREPSAERQENTKYEESYLWPSINLEDLVKGPTFLILLNARGRNDPNVFAAADGEAIRIGIVSLATVPIFTPKYAMILRGQKKVETYGKVASWEVGEEGEEAKGEEKEKEKEGDEEEEDEEDEEEEEEEEEEDFISDEHWASFAISPGEGLFVLRIQARILSFLNHCCRLILHDMPATSLTDICIPVQPEPARPLDPTSSYNSLITLAAEAPYRVPDELDYPRLMSLIAAKRAEAEDHIWMMREDPGYFADVLGERSEHHRERILDPFKKIHSSLKGKGTKFWDKAVQNCIGNDYCELMMWTLMQDQVVELAALHEKYAHSISPDVPLPEEYAMAISQFQYFLDYQAGAHIRLLKLGLVSSPIMRSNWLRLLGKNDVETTNIHYKGSFNIMTKDKLMWVFVTLMNMKKTGLLGLHNLVEEIEHLMKASEQRARISPWIFKVFSSLAFTAEIQRQFTLFQPFSRTMMEHPLETCKEHCKQNNRITNKAWVFANLMIKLKIGDLGNPAGGQYRYPVEKRRTKANVDAMRLAEQNLKTLWDTVDAHIMLFHGETLHEFLRDYFPEERKSCLTPEWVPTALKPRYVIELPSEV